MINVHGMYLSITDTLCHLGVNTVRTVDTLSRTLTLERYVILIKVKSH